MSNLTDLISSGGGANIQLKASTAVAAYGPVTEGQYYKLNQAGKLVAATSVLAETASIDQSVLSQTNGGTAGWSSKDAIPFAYGGKFEGTMPNGNILYPFGRLNGSGSYLSVAYVVLDSKGTQLSFVDSYPQDTTYNNPKYKVSYQGEDSTYYIFTTYTHGSNSNSSYSTLRGYTVTVRKSDNAITVTANSDLAYILPSSIKTEASRHYGGELTFARDKSVYCSVAISTAASSSNMTLELTSGTVNSAYAQANVGTTTIASVYSAYNIQLIKYDDSSANFLLAYQNVTGNTATGYVVKKVLVAANGSHTITDITPAAFSQGTGTTQQRALWSSLSESEQTGKYLWHSTNSLYELRYQKAAYDGSAITVGSFQKYNSSGALFRYQQLAALASVSVNASVYRYEEDKIYIAPRETHTNWSGYAKGAVWVLGSGNVSNTAVETVLFDSLSKEMSGSQSLISINYSTGLVTERIDAPDTFVNGQTTQVFDVSPKTKAKIAYARQTGSKGETVAISLIEGVTSSDSLSSAYWLHKEDMYYALKTLVAPPPEFSYLKPVAYSNTTVSTAVQNAASLGTNSLTIVAPEGRYLRIEAMYAAAALANTGVKIDGVVLSTRIGVAGTANAHSNYLTIMNGNSAGGPSIAAPIICREFSFYRSASGSSSGAIYLTYMVGEPA